MLTPKKFTEVYARLLDEEEPKGHSKWNNANREVLEFIRAGGDMKLSQNRITAVMGFACVASACNPGLLSKIAYGAAGVEQQLQPIIARVSAEVDAEEKLSDPKAVLPIV